MTAGPFNSLASQHRRHADRRPNGILAGEHVLANQSVHVRRMIPESQEHDALRRRNHFASLNYQISSAGFVNYLNAVCRGENFGRLELAFVRAIRVSSVRLEQSEL